MERLRSGAICPESYYRLSSYRRVQREIYTWGVIQRWWIPKGKVPDSQPGRPLPGLLRGWWPLSKQNILSEFNCGWGALDIHTLHVPRRVQYRRDPGPCYGESARAARPCYRGNKSSSVINTAANHESLDPGEFLN